MALTQEQIQQLENYANDIPTRYGMPIITFLNQKKQEKVLDEVQEEKTIESHQD
jgi:ssDNA-binding replication factor A large subunit